MNEQDKPDEGGSWSISELVEKIYDGIEPTPIRYWTLAGSIPSESIKFGLVRHIVRKYIEAEDINMSDAEFSRLSERLFDKLCYESIKTLIETDQEYRDLKTSGKFDEVYQEVKAEAEAKVRGSRGQFNEESARVLNVSSTMKDIKW